MSKPLLSIIIANFNYGRFLEEAIQSVVSQGMGDKIELIICDAASSDNSVDVIKKYANGLPPSDFNGSGRLISWWCSEKDGGQSAAFNKGFSHASGEWLTWLNADDILLPGTLKAFARLVEKKPKAEWVTGNKIHFNSSSRKIVSVHWGPHWQPPFLRGTHAFNAVFGPTSFWKRSLYDRMGPIDENLYYTMDTEYWARFTMAGVRQTRLNHFCWGFRIHDDSKTEGVQSTETRKRQRAETAYWKTKLGYHFEKSLSNIWYVMWLFWRVLDGSLVNRFIMKIKLTNKPLNIIH